MTAKPKILKGWLGAMTTSRSDQAAALEKWADRVDSADLKEANTDELKEIAELAAARDQVDNKIIAAVRSARRSNRS